MSIHVCTFFGSFAQSRHILSFSPDPGTSLEAAGTPPRAKSGVCMYTDVSRAHILRSKKSCRTAAFFRDSVAQVRYNKKEKSLSR